MTTQTETPQEQPKVEKSGLDRLDQMAGEETATKASEDLGVELTEKPAAKTEEVKTEIKTEDKPEVKAEETMTDEIKEETKEEVIEEEIGFKDSEVQAETDSWKAILEAKGAEIPADYNEENGFEFYEKFLEQKHQKELEEVRSFKETEIFTSLPEETRAEAQMTLELMKTGLTLEQIFAPIQQLKEYKAMSKEALVRLDLEREPGVTPEEVDFQMEELIAKGKLDLKYNILKRAIDDEELFIQQNNQARIDHYNKTQNAIKEQKRNQEIQSVKAALDKMPTFMERKLSEENKKSILNDYQQEWDKLTAADKVEMIAYKRYGKQSLQYLQSRAIENATKEKAKSQHNVPVVNAGGSKVDTPQYKDGLDRLEKLSS